MEIINEEYKQELRNYLKSRKDIINKLRKQALTSLKKKEDLNKDSTK